MAGINFKAFFEKANPVTNVTVRHILIAAATALAVSLGANPVIVDAVSALLGSAPVPTQSQPAP